MKEKQTMLKSLKDTLQQAHDMVKHFADRNRSKNLSWQEMVYLKMQSYHKHALGKRNKNHKQRLF